MVALNSRQRTRRNFVKNIRAIHRDHFGLTDADIHRHNQAWSDWLALKDRDEQNLRSIAIKTGKKTGKNADVAPAHMGRALAMLMTPEFKLSPFDWDTPINRVMGVDHIVFERLDQSLRRFVFKLLPICLSVVQVRKNRKHKWSVMGSYNVLVGYALSELDEDDPLAIEIYELWQPDDRVLYWNHDRGEGDSRVWFGILRGIPITWKWRLHECMKQLIKNELLPASQLSPGQSIARASYLRLVQHALIQKEGFPYEIDLLAAQIEFLIGTGNVPGEIGFEDRHCLKILNLLSADCYQKVREKFSRYILYGDRGEDGAFKAYDESRVEALRLIDADLGEGDPDLRARVYHLIAEGEKYQSQCEAQAAEIKRKEPRILAKMAT